MNEYNIDVEEPPTIPLFMFSQTRYSILCDIPSVRAVYRRFTFEDFAILVWGCSFWLSIVYDSQDRTSSFFIEKLSKLYIKVYSIGSPL